MAVDHAGEQAAQIEPADVRQRVRAAGKRVAAVLPEALVVVGAAGAFAAGGLEARHEGGDQATLGAELLEVEFSAHRVVGRFQRGLRPERDLVHAVAVLGDDRGHRNADRGHARDVGGEEVLVGAGAGEVVG